jgi:hypothetical protein
MTSRSSSTTAPARDAKPAVRHHFEGRSPTVRDIYTRIVGAARAVGPVREEPKKTSIHLVRRSAFAGIATRKDALILTIKSAADIRSRRIVKREQASAHRWHLEIRLDDPAQVDDELTSWLTASIRLSE